MNDHPALLVLMIGVGIYTFSLWRHDYAAARAGFPNPSSLPGATQVSFKTCLIAALGAMAILVTETWGEIHLGLSEQQSKITVLFATYSLVGAFIEELIFRGFIFPEKKTGAFRWLCIFSASLIFSALHPFLWKWTDGSFEWTITPKGWFSTGAVFISSLWFYLVRSSFSNHKQSLIPCIVAHGTKNLGVFAIKLIQGFVIGLY